jgi:hypothetical protein
MKYYRYRMDLPGTIGDVVLTVPNWVNRVPLEMNLSKDEYGGFHYVLSCEVNETGERIGSVWGGDDHVHLMEDK